MPENNEKLRILYLSSEVSPFSKSGGLGEVSAALPKELCRLGADCRVVTPKYGSMPGKLLTGLEFQKSYETSLSWRKQRTDVYTLERDMVTYYFIGNDYYFGRDGYYGYGDDFERFAFFSKAAVELAGVMDFKPHVIHANDWQTGLACLYVRDKLRKFIFYNNVKSLFTIHNLQYQGIFSHGVLSSLDLDDGYFSVGGLEFYNNISLLKAGIAYSDAVSTVSPTYASEIQTPAYGFSMDGVIRQRSSVLHGIINGIDYEKNNPAKDPEIFVKYSAETFEEGKRLNKTALQAELNLPVNGNVPVFAIISRLTNQKGLDILAIAMDELLNKDVQLLVLGQGDSHYEQLFNYYKWKYPNKCYVQLGFETELAQKMYAGVDFFLMPSMFEPCGLGQMTAMRYGTLPIVRNTGGLADTVRHFNPATGEGNGFVFEDYVASGLMWAINQALDCFGDKSRMNAAINNAMSEDYSWGKSAKEYMSLYSRMSGFTGAQ